MQLFAETKEGVAGGPVGGMAAAVRLSAHTFTPADCEELALVPQHMQREWRRRGFARYHEGRAKYHVFELCEMLALRLLTDRIPPLKALDISARCGHGIVWHLLKFSDSYSGDHTQIFCWDREKFGRIQEMQNRGMRAARAMPAGGAPDLWQEMTRLVAELGTRGWGDQCDWLRSRIFADAGITEPVSARFFIWWADGHHEWSDDPTRSFDSGVAADRRFDGPVMILDLAAIAGSLAERAIDRPFIDVELTHDVT